MPDRLSPPRWRVWLVVLAGFAGAGVSGGLLWEWLWTPPLGVVVDGTWVLAGDAARRDFTATGSYAVIGAVAGLLLGTGFAWWYDGLEPTVLAAVLVGSVAAGALMTLTGALLGPPDPRPLAEGRPDGTRLPADLRVTGVAAHASVPLGAVTGVVGVLFLTLPRRGEADARRPPGGYPSGRTT